MSRCKRCDVPVADGDRLCVACAWRVQGRDPRRSGPVPNLPVRPQ